MKKKTSYKWRKNGGCQRWGWGMGEMGDGSEHRTSSYKADKPWGYNVGHEDYN